MSICFIHTYIHTYYLICLAYRTCSAQPGAQSFTASTLAQCQQTNAALLCSHATQRQKHTHYVDSRYVYQSLETNRASPPDGNNGTPGAIQLAGRTAGRVSPANKGPSNLSILTLYLSCGRRHGEPAREIGRSGGRCRGAVHQTASSEMSSAGTRSLWTRGLVWVPLRRTSHASFCLPQRKVGDGGRWVCKCVSV